MKVPKSMLEKYEIIAPLITDFCEEYLNEEYADVSLLMLEKLCRKRPSPLLHGRPNTWACGIVYTIGSNNFLFDKSQTPYMRASDLAEEFGISQSTAGSKAAEIKKLLHIGVFDPEWTLPSKLGENPMVWMFETSNGFIFDARYASRAVQEDLFNAGQIPFIPADRKAAKEAQEEENITSEKTDTPKKKQERKVVEGQISFDDDPVFISDYAEPSAKPSKPIIYINKARSDVSLGEIKDYCENNKDFGQILKKFGDGYIQVFNKRKAAFRNEVKIYLQRNFNTWYYSANSPVLQVSTARFINSDVCNMFGEGAVVFPVCRPVFDKSKIADLEYTFRVFTLDDHPFISDLRLFLETIKSIRVGPKNGETIDSIFTYLILNFSNITESAEFAFKERPYIIVLGEMCERMSFISISDARDGITYNEDVIDAFFSMSGKEKLGRVIDELIGRFVKCIDGLEISGKQPSAEEVLGALQGEHDFESFVKSLFGDIFYNLVDDMESFTDEGHDHIEWFESMDEEMMIEFFEAQSVIRVCCSHFFTTFGQYLQLILPEYDNPFAFSTEDDGYLEALENAGENSDNLYYKMGIGAMIYHIPPGGYSLTPLGADWFGIDMSGQDDRLYPPVLPGYYREILDSMLSDDPEGAVDSYMHKLLSDQEQEDNLISMFEDFFDYD